MARIGYGRTRQELPHTVKTILDKDKRPNPFHDNKPGRACLDGFKTTIHSLLCKQQFS